MEHIVPLPPVFKPGERFDYGGLAMQIAGRMAEVALRRVATLIWPPGRSATGKDWETLFQERIARPLQMTNTHFTPVDQGGGHSPMLAPWSKSRKLSGLGQTTKPTPRGEAAARAARCATTRISSR